MDTKFEQKDNLNNDQSDQNNNQEVKKRDFRLRPKVFKIQDSYISKSLESKDMKSAYHIMLAFLVYFFIINTIYYLTNAGEFYKEIKYAIGLCDHIEIFWLQEVLYLSLVFSVIYPLTRYWVNLRSRKDADQFKIDLGFAFIICSIIGSFYLVMLKIIFHLNIGVIMTLAILVEKIRITMKIQAFVIESKRKQETALEKDNKSAMFATRKQLLFFLFAPTLVYRDEYPRLKNRDYKLLFKLSLQYFITLYIMLIMVYRVILPIFSDIGKKQIDGRVFLKNLSILFLTASLTSLLVFYGFLHLYNNICSQIFLFGDRIFYEDWWTCTDYSTFYRKWNILVHDWIYAYLYTPFVYFFKGNKIIAGVLAIYVSALGHEYVLAIALRHVNPILTILFAGFGVLLFIYNSITKIMFKKKMKKLAKKDADLKKEVEINDEKYAIINTLFLFAMFNGWFLMVLIYGIGYFTKQNCMPNDSSWFTTYSSDCLNIKF